MKLSIEKDVSLATHTTLLVGGVARYFYRLQQENTLIAVADFVEKEKIPLWVFGGGSNVLIDDGRINRLVVKNELGGIWCQQDNLTNETVVTAAAGEKWDDFVLAMVDRGLSGLENLSGIPGTVGAAPIQNINAYGAEVAKVIDSVRVFDVDARIFKTLRNTDCMFGYRDSLFKSPAGAGLIVTAVTFRLAPAGVSNLNYRSSSQSIDQFLKTQGITSPTLGDVRNAILHVRKNIGMLEGQFHSAGSFFKNTIVSQADFANIEHIVKKQFADQDEKFSPWNWPLPSGTVKISTAFLMECSPYNKHTYGKKRWGGVVGISPKHSLSIVTEDGATAVEVRAFATEIVNSIKKIFGITIETEVNFVSN